MNKLVLTAILMVAAPGASYAANMGFDFESGDQGWIDPLTSIVRVPTQVLGGAHALFGDGRLFDELPCLGPLPCDRTNDVGMVLDLSNTHSIRIDFHYAGSLELVSPADFFEVQLDGASFGTFESVARIDVMLTSERTGSATFDVSDVLSPRGVFIHWVSEPLACPLNAFCVATPDDAAIGFIDNIVLLP